MEMSEIQPCGNSMENTHNNEQELENLNSFANARGKPSVFLILSESLQLKHLIQLRTKLGDQEFEELDLVIHSGGGNIHVAYQMIQLLRLHAECINACVPFYAKSAATLLCLGADTIFVDKLAQLGPLDTQIYEEKKGGMGEFSSALNPFKTLEQLRKFSLETLDITVKMIAMRSGMDLDECLKHAIQFVHKTTGPLFTQLNSEKLGEYSRALAIGSEYGDRLLRRFASWNEDKRMKILEKLVHGYPSHDYIIDYHELQEMGFNVNLFSENEQPAVLNLLINVISSEKNIVAMILPSEKSNNQQSSEVFNTP